MKRFLRDNGLTLVFIGLFLLSLVGEAISGWHVFNSEQQSHGQATYGLGRYLLSSDFGADLTENWQSEFLQFASFIALSMWFKQRGSTESKEPDDSALGSDKEQKVGRYAEEGSPLWAKAGGWRTVVYGNTLLAVVLFLWLASWGVQSVTSWNAYNGQQQEHKDRQVSWASYLTTADFWDRSTQNWQSEFLAVASISVFTVFLRQRGSEQSKPVGAPHEETGVSA